MIFASDASWPFAMNNVIYFAYGSDMLTPRLRHRAPSSVLLSTASLPQHRLHFHKRSKDGSGKCNAFRTGNASDAVYGALFEIPQEEKRKLDRTEGLGSGYHEQSVQVVLGGFNRSTQHSSLLIWRVETVCIWRGMHRHGPRGSRRPSSRSAGRAANGWRAPPERSRNESGI
jgi:hypothetical protein